MKNSLASKGLSMSQAQSISNLCNQRASDISALLNNINNVEKKFDEVLCLNRHCCAFGDPSEVLTEDVIQEMYGSHTQILKEHTPGNHGNHNGN